MYFPKNRNIFHNHQFLAVVGRAMRAPTNGAENRNLIYITAHIFQFFSKKEGSYEIHLHIPFDPCFAFNGL